MGTPSMILTARTRIAGTPRGTEVTLSILRDGHEQQVRARLTSLSESSALVGEIKKGRYVCYFCTGYKGKCPEPYTREEVLEKSCAELLKGISFSEEAMGWVSRAADGPFG
jgi:hypothetical protein